MVDRVGRVVGVFCSKLRQKLVRSKNHNNGITETKSAEKNTVDLAIRLIKPFCILAFQPIDPQEDWAQATRQLNQASRRCLQ